MDRATLELNVLRNALYHQGRRRRLERLTRWSNFFIILLGASAMGDVTRFAGYEGWAPAIGAATVAIGAFQLVFDFGGRARDHQVLQRDYYNLFAEIDAMPEASAEDIARFLSAMTRIAAGEPPSLRALDAKAYNDALSGLGHWSENERLHIPLWHKVAGPYLDFDGYRYRTLAEVGAGQRKHGASRIVEPAEAGGSLPSGPGS